MQNFCAAALMFLNGHGMKARTYAHAEIAHLLGASSEPGKRSVCSVVLSRPWRCTTLGNVWSLHVMGSCYIRPQWGTSEGNICKWNIVKLFHGYTFYSVVQISIGISLSLWLWEIPVPIFPIRHCSYRSTSCILAIICQFHCDEKCSHSFHRNPVSQIFCHNNPFPRTFFTRYPKNIIEPPQFYCDDKDIYQLRYWKISITLYLWDEHGRCLSHFAYEFCF